MYFLEVKEFFVFDCWHMVECYVMMIEGVVANGMEFTKLLVDKSTTSTTPFTPEKLLLDGMYAICACT